MANFQQLIGESDNISKNFSLNKIIHNITGKALISCGRVKAEFESMEGLLDDLNQSVSYDVVGVMVSSIPVYDGMNQVMGANKRRVVYSYLPETSDFEESEYKSRVNFYDWRDGFLENCLSHELVELFSGEGHFRIEALHESDSSCTGRVELAHGAGVTKKIDYIYGKSVCEDCKSIIKKGVGVKSSLLSRCCALSL